MKVICIIPARGGSKGLPFKNVKFLDGVPLVGRTILSAIQSGVCDQIVVTTDDENIANVARKYGAQVPFCRPSELSGDLSTTEETLRHALEHSEKFFQEKFDIGVFLSPTDVFRETSWIRKSVALLLEKPSVESVFVGYATHKNFWERTNTGEWKRLRPWMSVYSSRQIRRTVIREDTGLACASRTWLWREGRRIGDKVEIIINNDDFSSIDIHTLEDLELAQAALNIRQKKVSESEL
jgi:CMP-N,N'-diacetyllegionaminic acid synthase